MSDQPSDPLLNNTAGAAVAETDTGFSLAELLGVAGPQIDLRRVGWYLLSLVVATLASTGITWLTYRQSQWVWILRSLVHCAISTAAVVLAYRRLRGGPLAALLAAVATIAASAVFGFSLVLAGLVPMEHAGQQALSALSGGVAAFLSVYLLELILARGWHLFPCLLLAVVVSGLVGTFVGTLVWQVRVALMTEAAGLSYLRTGLLPSLASTMMLGVVGGALRAVVLYAGVQLTGGMVGGGRVRFV